MDLQVGQTFGDYLITALLDAGSIGQVYQVEHSITRRTEVMKVLAAELATEIQIQRFEREMRVLARLSHPNIAALHNAIHSEKQLVLLMEFVDGRTLENIFSAGRLPIDEGLGYIRQILLALWYAHQQGVVHRDVTPANITITTAGEVKLTDFGLSKSFGDPLLTNCGEILGSLPYLAPERLKGATQPDKRSDLYSVGAILYEHLTGHKPFGVNRRLAPVLTDTEDDPLPPSQRDPNISPQWDQIIHRALDKNPEHRYRTAEEFLDALAKVDQEPMAELPRRRRTLGLGIALAVGLSVALFASPSLNPFRSVAPLAVPLDRLHIAPPDLAMSSAPPPSAPAPVAKHVAHSVQTSTPAPKKRTFWSKLNVFKKKKDPQ